jgi:hypothetical protein
MLTVAAAILDVVERIHVLYPLMYLRVCPNVPLPCPPHAPPPTRGFFPAPHATPTPCPPSVDSEDSNREDHPDHDYGDEEESESEEDGHPVAGDLHRGASARRATGYDDIERSAFYEGNSDEDEEDGDEDGFDEDEEEAGFLRGRGRTGPDGEPPMSSDPEVVRKRLLRSLGLPPDFVPGAPGFEWQGGVVGVTSAPGPLAGSGAAFGPGDHTVVAPGAGLPVPLDEWQRRRAQYSQYVVDSEEEGEEEEGEEGEDDMYGDEDD